MGTTDSAADSLVIMTTQPWPCQGVGCSAAVGAPSRHGGLQIPACGPPTRKPEDRPGKNGERIGGFSGQAPIPTPPFCLLPPSACFLLFILEYMAVYNKAVLRFVGLFLFACQHQLPFILTTCDKSRISTPFDIRELVSGTQLTLDDLQAVTSEMTSEGSLGEEVWPTGPHTKRRGSL